MRFFLSSGVSLAGILLLRWLAAAAFFFRSGLLRAGFDLPVVVAVALPLPAAAVAAAVDEALLPAALRPSLDVAACTGAVLGRFGRSAIPCAVEEDGGVEKRWALAARNVEENGLASMTVPAVAAAASFALPEPLEEDGPALLTLPFPLPMPAPAFVEDDEEEGVALVAI